MEVRSMSDDEQSDFEDICDEHAAGDDQEYYIDYVTTEDGEGNEMDVVRFMHKQRDREPMVPAPYVFEMMNSGLDRDRRAAVSRLIVHACAAGGERYLEPDDNDERWLISLANDTAYKPKTRMLSTRMVCRVLRADSARWGDQQRALMRPMKMMAADVVAAKLGGLHYYSSLYVGDEVALPPSESTTASFGEIHIKSKGADHHGDVSALMVVECDPDCALNVTTARVFLSDAYVVQGMKPVYAKPALFNSACGSLFGARRADAIHVFISGSEDDWVPLHRAVFTPDYARRELWVSARTEEPPAATPKHRPHHRVRSQQRSKQRSRPEPRPCLRDSLPREAKRICTERLVLQFNNEEEEENRGETVESAFAHVRRVLAEAGYDMGCASVVSLLAKLGSVPSLATLTWWVDILTNGKEHLMQCVEVHFGTTDRLLLARVFGWSC